MPQEFSVGVVVFCKEEFLLLHYEAGHWGFVKGNVETGEKPEETARRELKEETGIKAIHLAKGFKEKEEYFYKKEGKTVHKEVIYLLAETKEKKVTLSYEHTGYKWVSYEEAMQIITHMQTKNILKKAYLLLQQHS